MQSKDELFSLNFQSVKIIMLDFQLYKYSIHLKIIVTNAALSINIATWEIDSPSTPEFGHGYLVHSFEVCNTDTNGYVLLFCFGFFGFEF